MTIPLDGRKVLEHNPGKEFLVHIKRQPVSVVVAAEDAGLLPKERVDDRCITHGKPALYVPCLCGEVLWRNKSYKEAILWPDGAAPSRS